MHSKGVGPYTKSIKSVEEDIKKISKHVNEICGMYYIANLLSHTAQVLRSLTLVLRNQVNGI